MTELELKELIKLAAERRKVAFIKAGYPAPKFYINKKKRTTTCAIGNYKATVRLADGEKWNEYAGKLAAYLKLVSPSVLRDINEAEVVDSEKKGKTNAK